MKSRRTRVGVHVSGVHNRFSVLRRSSIRGGWSRDIYNTSLSVRDSVLKMTKLKITSSNRRGGARKGCLSSDVEVDNIRKRVVPAKDAPKIRKEKNRKRVVPAKDAPKIRKES